MAPFSFPWKGKPMAIVLDNDLLDRWLEAQRQINEVQALRDAAKERDEKELELNERIGELEAEIETLEADVESLSEQLASLQ